MKNYIIDKNNSQKHKKAYGIKKQKKRSNSLNQISSKAIVITTIFIGTLGFIKNNPTNSEQDDITNNTTISYKVDKNLPIYNDLNIKSQNNLNTVYFREKADLFEVNCHKDIRYVEKFIKSDDYKYFEKYANMYGIDPQIMVAIAMQESALDHEACLPNGEKYNGCATGIMQIEDLGTRKVTAYNYDTNKYETEYFSNDTVLDYENNIKIGCMLFQSAIEHYNGNIYMAIQSHNYGEEVIEKIVKKTAKELNISPNELTSDYSDLRWMKYLPDVHNNPLNYVSKWNYDTYGDDKYLIKILSYCPNSIVKYKYEQEDISFDLQSASILNSRNNRK